MKSFRSLASVVGIGLLFALAGCSNGVALGPSAASTATASVSTTTSTTASTTTTTVPAAPGATTTVPVSTPAPTPATVAYTDLVPLFASDCTPCHGTHSPKARYSTASYSGVMAAVTPRSASSALVFVTQAGGSMYGFLSGDRAGKAAQIRTWVLNGAPQTR